MMLNLRFLQVEIVEVSCLEMMRRFKVSILPITYQSGALIGVVCMLFYFVQMGFENC